MYFVLKATLRSLALPPALPLLIAALGALLLVGRRRGGAILLATGLGSLWLFCTPLVADALWQAAQRYPAFDPGRPDGAQCIVIIGGGGYRRAAPEYAGPAPEFGMLERLDYGAYLARRMGLPVLVSGAPGEAAVMQASLLRDFGISAWVENASRDTYENARFSAPLLAAHGVRHILLITSATHVWRAAQEFAAAGLVVTAAPVGLLVPKELDPLRFVPSANALVRSNAAVYELLGEPARRVQAALGLRERFDKGAAASMP